MVDQGMVQVLNEEYLRKAVSGRIALQENLVRPEAIVTLEQKEDGSAAVIKREEPGRMRKIPLSSGGRLILEANRNGGTDNIAVVLVEIIGQTVR